MAAPPKGRTKVLVAHDERLIAETLRIILNRNGFETTCVYSGKHAIDAAREWGPHVFLSETTQPGAEGGVDGLDAAIQICAIHPRCRVLLFSGQPDRAEQLRSGHTPAHDFEILLKPVPPVELLKRIRAALKNLPATA
jgi:DNA-binding response OmpR family regulator